MQRGEIYFVNLNPVVGREQAGRRPVVVVSTDDLNLAPLVVTIVPGTTSPRAGRRPHSTVRVLPAESGLPQETFFLCFQVRALDHSRFTDPPAGQLTLAALTRIEDTLRYCLGL
jgi:mRNA interferase MazF